MSKKNNCIITLVLGFVALMLVLLLTDNVYAFSNNEKDEDRIAADNFVAEVYPNISDTEKEKLAESIYEERMNSSGIELDFEEPVPYVQEEDPAYIAMMEEENYIVDLINGMGGVATLESWEYNLDFLKEHYNAITTQDNINKFYIDDYIESYTSVKAGEDTPDEKVYTGTSLLRSRDYNYGAAVQYAYNYGENYNPNYPNWGRYGGDCANFVSQCLYAGGKPMVGRDAKSVNSWFSRGNQYNTSKVSATWRGADMFKEYWKSKATAYRRFEMGGEETYNYTWPGDAVSLLNKNGRAYHTLICVSYSKHDKSTICYGHSGALSRNLSNVATPMIVYHMRASY